MQVLEFTSTLNVGVLKVFLHCFFGYPRQNINHSSEKVKVNLHKVFFVFTKINSQFKGSELKSVEKLLEQTVQAFKSC